LDEEKEYKMKKKKSEKKKDCQSLVQSQY